MIKIKKVVLYSTDPMHIVRVDRHFESIEYANDTSARTVMECHVVENGEDKVLSSFSDRTLSIAEINFPKQLVELSSFACHDRASSGPIPKFIHTVIEGDQLAILEEEMPNETNISNLMSQLERSQFLADYFANSRTNQTPNLQEHFRVRNTRTIESAAFEAGGSSSTGNKPIGIEFVAYPQNSVGLKTFKNLKEFKGGMVTGRVNLTTDLGFCAYNPNTSTETLGNLLRMPTPNPVEAITVRKLLNVEYKNGYLTVQNRKDIFYQFSRTQLSAMQKFLSSVCGCRVTSLHSIVENFLSGRDNKYIGIYDVLYHMIVQALDYDRRVYSTSCLNYLENKEEEARNHIELHGSGFID